MEARTAAPIVLGQIETKRQKIRKNYEQKRSEQDISTNGYQIFEKVMASNFPELKKDIGLHLKDHTE